MSSWHSYPKIYNIGHKAIEALFEGPVVVEEKIDGSQFSFGVHDGELKTRSRGRNFHPDAADKMFQRGVETAKALAPLLREGWTYRGEYLNKPKHNVLKYDRVPARNFILFDVEIGDSKFLSQEAKAEEASRLGLECVPSFYVGVVENFQQLRELMDRESCLGGPKMEGIVVKNYNRFALDGHPLMGKFVSEKFKEIHKKEWGKANPSSGDILAELAMRYKTEARWQKAVQHLAEAGELTESPKDIGALIKELKRDFEAECVDDCKEILYKWAAGKVKQSLTRGFPEWYKEQLAKKAFSE